MAKSKEPRLAGLFIVVGLVVFVIMLWFSRDAWIRHQRSDDCGDGPRYMIDTRQFETQYSAYSLQLEASLQGKGKTSLKLDPVQQEKLSEGIQSANEFRKFIVAGFNSCAVSKTQYASFGARLQALDGLARQINGLASQVNRSAEDNGQLKALVDEYAALAHELGQGK